MNDKADIWFVDTCNESSDYVNTRLSSATSQENSNN